MSIDRRSIAALSFSALAYSAGVTTVTLFTDAGVLDTGLSEVRYGFLSATNSAVPPTNTGKNKLINSNFAINQRGVSGPVVLAAGAYGHDRFKAGVGGCTYTFATALNVTTITILAGTLMQVIEGINLFSGIHLLSWVGQPWHELTRAATAHPASRVQRWAARIRPANGVQARCPRCNMSRVQLLQLLNSAPYSRNWRCASGITKFVPSLTGEMLV